MDTKMIIAGVTTAVVVAGIGLWSYLCGDEWEKSTESTDERFNKAFNDAVAEFPSDRAKAAFRFQTEAAKLREEFHAKWKDDARYKAWADTFDARVKAHVKSIRTSA